MAEELGESRNQIQRYIRLTELAPELQEMVDNKKIAFTPAVELSYLSESEQRLLLDAMDSERKGLFVPFKFDKDGTPKPGPALASLETLGQLQQELDGLVVQMAERLYAGQVAAEPLAHGKRKETNCKYCDYRSVCGHEDE